MSRRDGTSCDGSAQRALSCRREEDQNQKHFDELTERVLRKSSDGDTREADESDGPRALPEIVQPLPLTVQGTVEGRALMNVLVRDAEVIERNGITIPEYPR